MNGVYAKRLLQSSMDSDNVVKSLSESIRERGRSKGLCKTPENKTGFAIRKAFAKKPGVGTYCLVLISR